MLLGTERYFRKNLIFMLQFDEKSVKQLNDIRIIECNDHSYIINGFSISKLKNS